MNLNTSFQNAQGTIPYGLTNDYMFRAVLQSDNRVLRGLICALLHLTEKEVASVEITNPVILGESAAGKEIRLDINVLLNNRILINLEMQVTNRLNWQNRSVVYLCRSYDSLSRGQDYKEAKSAIHIGFLDYTLFTGHPEFYATYKLLNVKNHQKYSDNITLHVIDLSRIDLATEEDKKYHIDSWARLLKSTTWEEVKMLAAKDVNMREAARTLFLFNTDEQVRKMCRDREEYYEDIRNYERVILERDDSIECYQKAIEKRDQSIASYAKELSDRDQSIASYAKELSDRDQSIASYEKELSDRDQIISEKDAQIQQLLAENEKLRAGNSL